MLRKVTLAWISGLKESANNPAIQKFKCKLNANE